MKNFLIESQLGFDVNLDQFPHKNSRKWTKLTIPELHEMIRTGQMGFSLLAQENYKFFLDFSLGPYKYVKYRLFRVETIL